MVEIQNDQINPCEEVLAHHGKLGMKWGIRRYQPYPSDYTGDGKFVGKLAARKAAKIEKRQARHQAKTNTRIKNAVDTGDKKKLKKYQDEMTPEEYEKKYAEAVKNGIDNAVKDRDKSALKKYKEDLNKRDYKHQQDRIEFKEAVDSDKNKKVDRLLSKVDPEDVTEATNLIKSRVALQDQKLSKIRQDSELMAKMDKLASGFGKISKITKNVSDITSSVMSVNKQLTEFSKSASDAEKKRKEKELEKIVRSGDLDKIRKAEKDMNATQLNEAYQRIIQSGDERAIRKAAPYMDNKQITAAVQKLKQMDELKKRPKPADPDSVDIPIEDPNDPASTRIADASRSSSMQAVRDWIDSGFAASSDRMSSSDRHRFLINQSSAATTVGEVRSIVGSQMSSNILNEGLWWNSRRDGSYTIAHSDDISYEDVLAHDGVKGMHWYVRRYQPYPKGYDGEGKFVGKKEERKAAKAEKRKAKQQAKDNKRFEKTRKEGISNSEYAISQTEKAIAYKEKKATKIAKKYADESGHFKITKPRDAKKHLKIQEKIVADEKTLKELNKNLSKLRDMTFDNFSEQEIKDARALADVIATQYRSVALHDYSTTWRHQTSYKNLMFMRNTINHSMNMSMNMSMHTTMWHSDDISYEDVLMHHGTKGMHWYIRRYQPYPKGYKGEGKEVGQAKRVGLGDRKYQNYDVSYAKAGSQYRKKTKYTNIDGSLNEKGKLHAQKYISKQIEKNEKYYAKEIAKYEKKAEKYKDTNPEMSKKFKDMAKDAARSRDGVNRSIKEMAIDEIMTNESLDNARVMKAIKTAAGVTVGAATGGAVLAGGLGLSSALSTSENFAKAKEQATWELNNAKTQFKLSEPVDSFIRISNTSEIGKKAESFVENTIRTYSDARAYVLGIGLDQAANRLGWVNQQYGTTDKFAKMIGGTGKTALNEMGFTPQTISDLNTLVTNTGNVSTQILNNPNTANYINQLVTAGNNATISLPNNGVTINVPEITQQTLGTKAAIDELVASSAPRQGDITRRPMNSSVPVSQQRKMR